MNAVYRASYTLLLILLSLCGCRQWDLDRQVILSYTPWAVRQVLNEQGVKELTEEQQARWGLE